MILRLAGALALGVLILAGCNNDTLPPGARTASLRGVVIDDATQKPIAGATVSVETVMTASTDTAGTFKFDQVPSGDIDITVQAPGYQSFSEPLSVTPGTTTSLNISLKKTSP